MTGLPPGVPQRRRATDRPIEMPYGMRLAAAWAWRSVVILVALYLLLRAVAKLQVLIVPVLVALLLVALIRPVYEQLRAVGVGSWRVPPGLAAIVTILVTLAIVSGLIALIGQQVATGFPSLRDQASAGLDELQEWLEDGPLHITAEQLSRWVDTVQESLARNSDTVVDSAIEVTSTAGHVVTGFFIALFAAFFFLSGGRSIWSWTVTLFPKAARRPVDNAGNLAWTTLTSFVRATVLVALVDGAGVAIAAAILQVPLALPLGVLVFLGAFVPIVGAVVTGAVAVLVALVAQGPVVALIMLGAVIAVQQVEAHVLQPFLLGRAVSVHPLAVILAIGAGVLVAGIVGALFAVPFVAVANVVARYLAGGAPPLEEYAVRSREGAREVSASLGDEPPQIEDGDSDGEDGEGGEGAVEDGEEAVENDGRSPGDKSA